VQCKASASGDVCKAPGLHDEIYVGVHQQWGTVCLRNLILTLLTEELSAISNILFQHSVELNFPMTRNMIGPFEILHIESILQLNRKI